jgi:hypothetical protein
MASRAYAGQWEAVKPSDNPSYRKRLEYSKTAAQLEETQVAMALSPRIHLTTAKLEIMPNRRMKDGTEKLSRGWSSG